MAPNKPNTTSAGSIARQMAAAPLSTEQPQQQQPAQPVITNAGGVTRIELTSEIHPEMSRYFASVNVSDISAAEKEIEKDKSKIKVLRTRIGSLVGITSQGGEILLGSVSKERPVAVPDGQPIPWSIEVSLAGASGAQWAGVFVSHGSRTDSGPRAALKMEMREAYLLHRSQQIKRGAEGRLVTPPVKIVAPAVDLAKLAALGIV